MSVQTFRNTDLVRYLADRPTLDAVAQYLVLEAFRTHEPRGALVSVFGSDGIVSAAGSFGLTHDVLRAVRRLSLWDHSPSVDAIREGEPVVLNSRDEMRRQYPWLEGHETLLVPTLAWPLNLGSQRLGSLQINFAESFDLDAVSTVLSDIAPILGLYVSLRAARLVADSRSEESKHSHTREHKPVEQELTTRQLRILHLLAEGMTNPQIAARIGFSDSTVRQETMAIYRFLGAEGRRDAVQIASLRGLLNEDNRVSAAPAMLGHG